VHPFTWRVEESEIGVGPIVRGGELVAQRDPPGPDVVRVPKELQPPAALGRGGDGAGRLLGGVVHVIMPGQS
jgi:hypothetical protein